jgi:hypothetical protein
LAIRTLYVTAKSGVVAPIASVMMAETDSV